MAPVSTVIKVKFGNTLRRYNALICKEEFNFNMAMLKEKICTLFGFTPDVDFTLTYIDEDGDIVTLCDDNDLQDVAAQFLDPLRITVRMKTGNLDRSSLINSRVLEILKYVPEPLHDGLSKLLLLLASETPNSSMVLNEVVEKMQMTHLNKPSESKAGLMGALDNKDQQGLKITEPSKRSPTTYLEALTMNQPKVLGDDEGRSSDSKNKTVLIESVAKDLQPPRSMDLNVPYSGPVGFGASNPDYLKHCLQDSKMKEISAINECPFKGMMPSSSNSKVHPYPFKRSYNHRKGLDNILQCDGCGVHLILGPYFKSKVKDDYHICSICIEDMGDYADYIKMHYYNSSPFKGFQDHMNPSTKLDSCFVLDVNVYDGTFMAPSTMFTKIWRMRNNGEVMWPHGSQLLWTGGDWLSDTVSVEVEIPADGLPVDQEVDIAVDFVAPEFPGQYVSYWRMASPSGEKFGQRVWIYVQVVDGVMDSGKFSINLNLPPAKDPEVVKPGMGHENEFHQNHFVEVVEPDDMCLDADPYGDQVMTLRK